MHDDSQDDAREGEEEVSSPSNGMLGTKSGPAVWELLQKGLKKVRTVRQWQWG